MTAADLSSFEAYSATELSAGFYHQIQQRKGKKLVLLRTPKHITAEHLDGVRLEVTSSKTAFSSSVFPVEDKATKTSQLYQVTRGVDAALAPVALVLPTADGGALAIERAFDQVWNVGLVVDLGARPAPAVDLEDDIGGKSWKPIPQAMNLRKPLSVIDIGMARAGAAAELAPTLTPSPAKAKAEKKAKKRKHAPEE